jgi:hypothetical protein
MEIKQLDAARRIIYRLKNKTGGCNTKRLFTQPFAERD